MVYPIVTIRSDGSKVWDVDRNEYVDFVMGFGVSLFGHRPSFVVQAIHEQLDRGFEIGPIHPLAGEVAALVREFTGLERVSFTNTGSEAVAAAIRVARTVTGRDKIVVFAGAYHGVFDQVLVRSVTVNNDARTVPIAPGIPNSALSQVIVLDYGNPQSIEILRAHGSEIAAVLVEPVQSRRLDLQPREFLHELRRTTERTGSALIFDEVLTGFRVHPGGAQAHFGVRADLATYGKVLGGGLPIGVVAGAARFMDALDGGHWQYGDRSFPEAGVTFFAGTFVRHPLALAAAKAVLTHLKQSGPELQQKLTERTAQLAIRLRTVIEEFQAPYHLTQFSSLIQLTFAPEQTFAGLLYYLLRERGIHISENRAFVMTTAHGDDDVARLIRAVREGLSEMQSAGFLPPSSGLAVKSTISPAIRAAETPPLDPSGTFPDERRFDTPGDPLERTLTQIWSKVLKVKRVGLHDNFFELGGHSLAAVRLLAEIQKVTGKALPLAALFQASTVEALASLLRKDGWTPSWSDANSIAASQVIPIRSAGFRPPLFFLGPQPLFRALILRLPEDQPVFAVSVLNTSTLPVPYRLEDIAAHYLEMIHKFHPDGPYALAGWCNDGVLAYEMAQQVRAQGGSVPLVVMLESFHSSGPRGRARWVARKERLRFHLANISTVGAKQAVEYLRQRLETLAQSIRAYSWRASYKFHLRAGRLSQRLRVAEQIMPLVVREYRPQPFGGPVLLVRAQKRPVGADAALGWRGLVPDLEVVDVPGNHVDMFVEPNVEVLANALSAQLLKLHHEYATSSTTGAPGASSRSRPNGTAKSVPRFT